MKNIKNSDFNDLFKLLNVIISIIIHMILIFYPLTLVTSEIVEQRKEKKEIEEVIELQLIENKTTMTFAEVNNVDKLSEEKINNSSILSNKNISIKNKLSYANKKVNDKNIKDQVGNLNKNKEHADAVVFDDVDGDHTDINTVKFKYFDYYIKIKKEVESKWKSVVSSYLMGEDFQGRVFKTVLILKIDKEGFIRNVNVKRSSGSKELDKIALSSFDNKKIEVPPEGLFNQKDFIYLYWGFALKI